MDLKFRVAARISKPVHEVFEAVADPKQLSEYFTTGGASARLETGATVSWDFHDFPGAFPVEVVEVENVVPLKTRLGVPEALMSCHTAEIGGYVVEGHVPAEAIKRLLAEKPKAIGLAVAGMPVGSPGMEVPGQPPQSYEIEIFSADRQHVFARYRGLQQI